MFTRDVLDLMSDDDYHALQLALLLRPEAGSIIQGSGGPRKLRWSILGFGKRGGVRVIYYWVTAEDVIYMLVIYRKSRQEDLTLKQLKGGPVDSRLTVAELSGWLRRGPGLFPGP